jgi:hypothetical protein
VAVPTTLVIRHKAGFCNDQDGEHEDERAHRICKGKVSDGAEEKNTHNEKIRSSSLNSALLKDLMPRVQPHGEFHQRHRGTSTIARPKALARPYLEPENARLIHG